MIQLNTFLVWQERLQISLFYSAAHIADIADLINYDLQLLTNLARQWLVAFIFIYIFIQLFIYLFI